MCAATALNRDTRFLHQYLGSLREGGAAAGRPLLPTAPPLTTAEDAPLAASRPPLPPRPPSMRRQISPEPVLHDDSTGGTASYQLAGEFAGSDDTYGYSRVGQPSGSTAQSNNVFTLLDLDAPPEAGGSQVSQSQQETAEPTRVSLPPEDDPFGDFVQSDFSSPFLAGDLAGTDADDNFKFSGFYSASSLPANAKSSGVYCLFIFN